MKLIIFDCDGTLVDSQHAIVAAMEQAFARHGLPAPVRSDVIGVVGLSLSPAIQRLLPTMRGAFIDEVADSYKQAFADLRRRPEHHEPLFPLAGEALAALAAEPDTLLGIATGKSRRGVDAVIEREGFHGLFATIQTADDNPSKPDPEMLLRAMRETGARSRDTVMIGDTTFDMEMARAAGTRALGVCWGYHPPELLVRAGAHDMIDGYEHLPAALARLLPAREATP